jgi:hypothetical protein
LRHRKIKKIKIKFTKKQQKNLEQILDNLNILEDFKTQNNPLEKLTCMQDNSHFSNLKLQLNGVILSSFPQLNKVEELNKQASRKLKIPRLTTLNQ